MTTIPASTFVKVTPSVLNAGGNALVLNGLVLTNSARVPIGQVLSFSSPDAVASFFGSGSEEAIFAGGGTNLGSGYFGGFDNSNVKPGSILFAQYYSSAVAAWLLGGNVSALTLTQLQAINGSLDVVVDGSARNAGTVNLSAASSFSSAAGIIQTDLNAALSTIASFTAAISATTMTVSAVGSGALSVGHTVLGSGVSAGTIITALGTGTGGAGTYIVNNSQSVGSEAMTTEGTPVAVTYDSVSGAFKITSGVTGAASSAAYATGTIADDLKLQAAQGATLSQGAAATTPGAFMDSVAQITQNWVSFATTFDPDGGSGNTQKLAFAAWANAQGNRYAYVCWDTDLTPTASDPATGSLGYLLAQANYSGTALLYEPTDMNLAAFVCGAIASIDFTQTNGRITFAYKSQTGLVASVTTRTAAVNLGGDPLQNGSFGNGYNYYGAVATPNQGFVFLQRGLISGPYRWLDSFINQVWLNNAFQLALLNFMTQIKSIPYNQVGYSLLEQALADPIGQGLNFGAYAPGTISAAQIAEVNNAAGMNVSTTLQTQGYYLQIKDANSQVRGSRGSPPMTFWYLDRGSVQAVNLASVLVQ